MNPRLRPAESSPETIEAVARESTPATGRTEPSATTSSAEGTPRAPRTSFTTRVATRLLSRISRETSSGRFIPEMDGLRFAAIGMVVLFHINGYLTAKSPLYRVAPPQSDWLAQAALVGFRGVELFFVISGFILGLPFAARHIKGASPVSLRKYYLRRLTRLEPPYFAAVLLMFMVAVLMQGKSGAALLPHIGASFLYLHDLIYGFISPVLGVSWSLEIEVQFYTLVPVLTLLFAIRNLRLRRFVMIALLLAVLSAQSMFLHHSPRASLSILAYLQYFLTGFLLADIFLASWNEAPQRSLLWDLAAFAGWPLLFVILHSQHLAHWLFPAWILVLYCAAFRGKLANRFFSNRWIAGIGGMCYSIYLIHYEVVSAVGRVVGGWGGTAPYWIYLTLQFVVIGVVIVIVCGLYFVAVEKPCMRRDWPQQLWRYGRSAVGSRFRETGVSAAD